MYVFIYIFVCFIVVFSREGEEDFLESGSGWEKLLVFESFGYDIK